jgi:hypothetical protein
MDRFHGREISHTGAQKSRAEWIHFRGGKFGGFCRELVIRLLCGRRARATSQITNPAATSAPPAEASGQR